jgi:hypothetical protein
LIEFDTSATVKAILAIAEGLEPATEQALDTLAEIGVTNARSTRLFKDQSGKLRKQIKLIPAGKLARSIIADTPYAPYVELGNRPNGTGQYIYPVKAKALRFVVNGEVIFRRRVKAHGPLPFMGTAHKLLLSFLPDHFINAFSRLFRHHAS